MLESPVIPTLSLSLSLSVCPPSTLLAHTDALGRTRGRRRKKRGREPEVLKPNR